MQQNRDPANHDQCNEESGPSIDEMSRRAYITEKYPYDRQYVNQCLTPFNLDNITVLVLCRVQRNGMLDLLPPSHFFLPMHSVDQFSEKGFFSCSLVISDNLDKLFVSLGDSALLWFNVIDLNFK